MAVKLADREDKFEGGDVCRVGRDEDLFKLSQPPSTGLLLICMIEKHISIFMALQGHQGVAATPLSKKIQKKD